ncbi:DNA polymerase gamma [Peziza echinospora]|nr:DNA polymerase gamma [Peziza echinospora]
MEEFAQRALEEDLKERDLGADEELIPQKQYENDSSVAQPILPSQAKQNSISTNRKTPLSTGHNQRREIHYSRSLYNEVIGDTENSVENVEAGTEGVVSHEENNNEERITTGFEEATEEKHPGMQETPDEPSDGAKPKSEGIPAAERIKVSDRQLIPLGNPTVDRVVIGHNIGYDRARIKEEYNIKQTKTAYLDTMSLHVAVNGMCSRQRPTWLKHKKNVELKSRMMTEAYSDIQKQSIEDSTFEDGLEELWIGKSAINSLKDVALFHCNKTIDKGVRDQFGIIDRRGVLDQLDTLLDYCASDVVTTFEVYQKVLPEFLSVCPHPVSFGALRHLSSVILPVTEEWQTYIERAENKYQELLGGVNASLVELVEQAIAKFEEGGKERVLEDPWLSQLDWTAEEQRYLKLKKGQLTPTPARQRLVGKPKWYRDIVKKEGDIPAITTRSRAAVLLLGVAWDGYPLVWSDINGWTFKVPNTEVDKYKDKNVTKCDFSGEEKQLNLKEDTEHTYFKVPHKDGPTARCVTPMSKSFVKAFEDGILCGNTDVAKKALEMNAQCSYWISSRERIKSQMVVYEDDIEDMGTKDLKVPEGTEKKKLGIILPQLIPMGTITRRAVERTWLTASNAKKNRVGSELKSMVTAPPGYVFVGADVDSQELWIASLVGDAQLKIHGGTALGFMTLEGAKANGTDLHSKTASILGISRNHAKVFNYGRIYGAGLKFATTLLRQFNPSISDAEAEKTAENLYIQTKGKKVQRKNLMMVDKPFWYGGTESFVFNCLEDFADQERPRTPVLGSGLTMALLREYLTKGGFMTSRINWAIQSSGVDYLHLLVVSMDYLIRQYKIDARLAITVHDEIRYLVKEEDKYRSAMALQVANLWTRAMFSQQMGIEDLPQSCAYFSAVDIDHVLRKEVDLDCITPSHPEPIPHGESIDIIQLLEKGEVAALALDLEAENRFAKEFSEMVYQKREPVMETLQKSKGDFADQLKYMKAQMAKDEKAVVEVLKSWKQESTKPTKSTKSTASGNRNGNAVPWRKQETTQKSFPNYLPPSRPKPVYTLMMPKAKPAQQQPQEQAASKTSSTPEKTLAKNVNSK